jgi:RNA polymerase sigma-70 factor, ECF subfamily
MNAQPDEDEDVDEKERRKFHGQDTNRAMTEVSAGPAGEKHADLERVRRMLDGDREAFEGFFDAHFDAVYRFALSRLGGDERIAQDVVQTALVTAIEKLDTYRGESALLTWLCSICRFEISAHFRRRRREPASFEGTADGGELGPMLETLASSEPSREAELIEVEVRDRVHLALDHLPARYASALEWKYLEGLSVKDVAERLSLGPKAAESLLTRAREAFRQAFATLSRDLSYSDSLLRPAASTRSPR